MIDERTMQEAQYKERAYKEVANAFASSNNIWAAIHAQFLADILAPAAIGQANPGVSLDGTPPKIINKLKNSGIDVSVLDASEIVSILRNLIEEELPDEVKEDWHKRLSLLDYLVGKKASIVSAESRALDRLEGMPVDVFIQIRFNRSAEYARRAKQLMESGRKRDALDAARDSDFSALEGWLVARSLESGDTNLVITEIKWTLAKTAITVPLDPDEDFHKSINRTRGRLAWVLGKAEARDLARYLARI